MDDGIAAAPWTPARVARSLRWRLVSAWRRFGPEPAEPPLLFPGQPVPDRLVSLMSETGERLLAEAEGRGAYERLTAHFIAQRNAQFCGVATVVVILNALAAGSATHDQDSVFTPKTERIKRRREVVRTGIGLAQIAGFLTAHGVSAEARLASDSDADSFRATVVPALDDPRRCVGVSYHRPTLGQMGTGHSSPVAAYHRASNRLLVLDVARHRYPPVWVRVDDLFAAMTVAPRGVASRGYVVASA